MDDIIHVRLQLLEILYCCIGEFLAWSQLYETVQPGLNFPSPRLVLPWLRLVIRALENDLARVTGPNRNFRDAHLMSAYQRYLMVRLFIDRAHFSRNN